MDHTEPYDPATAGKMMMQAISKLADDTVELSEAVGRVLAEDLVAVQDLPPSDRVCMDGIAICSHTHATGPWQQLGIQMAGQVPQVLSDRRAAIEIATGAVCPAGADAIIRYEDLLKNRGLWYLKAGRMVKAQQNIQARASELSAGELMLQAGEVLHAPGHSLLSSQGITRVKVFKRPRIALLSNGDELVRPDQKPAAHQIRESNTSALTALLKAYHFDKIRLDHAADDEQELRAKILLAIEHCDVLVLMAGVSLGARDLVPRVLQQMGVVPLIRKVAQKPGRPLYFGMLQQRLPIFGLPGNPVAALMNFRRYVLPSLFLMESRSAPISQVRILDSMSAADVEQMLPVRCEVGDDGMNCAKLVKTLGSGDFASLRRTDGFISLAAQRSAHVGDILPFFAWYPGVFG